MNFTPQQTAQLLRPIAPQRVLRDAKGHPHVSQQDVTAHLIRVFGFGGFDTEILDVQCVFEDPHVKDGKPVPGRYDVCYRALLRLTVRDVHGKVVCQFEDGSTAVAQNQTRGDAHDLAYKSALSLAKKRAAINLGDQFGLSLYNKGQMSALVIDTLVKDAPGVDGQDLQSGVAPQVSLGNDEIDAADGNAASQRPVERSTPRQSPVTPAASEEQFEDPAELLALIGAAVSPTQLAEVGKAVAESPLSPDGRSQLKAAYSARMRELKTGPA